MTDQDSEPTHLLCLLAFHNGLITATQLQSALSEWLGQDKLGLDDILISSGFLCEDDFLAMRQIVSRRLCPLTDGVYFARIKSQFPIETDSLGSVLQLEAPSQSNAEDSPTVYTTRVQSKVTSKPRRASRHSSERNTRRGFYDEYYRSLDTDSRISTWFYSCVSFVMDTGLGLNRMIHRSRPWFRTGFASRIGFRRLIGSGIVTALAVISLGAGCIWFRSEGPIKVVEAPIALEQSVPMKSKSDDRSLKMGSSKGSTMSRKSVIHQAEIASLSEATFEQCMAAVDSLANMSKFEAAIAMVHEVRGESKRVLESDQRLRLDQTLLALSLAKGDIESYAEAGKLLIQDHLLEPRSATWKLQFAVWLIYSMEEDRPAAIEAIQHWSQNAGDIETMDVISAWLVARDRRNTQVPATLALAASGSKAAFPNIFYHSVALTHAGMYREARTQLKRARDLLEDIFEHPSYELLKTWSDDSNLRTMLGAMDKLESTLEQHLEVPSA